MKKKSLLAMSLMGLALVACSEDEQLNGGGTGNVNGVEGELAKVTLNVSVAAPQTKGNPNPEVEQAGTEAESTVKNLVIVADYGNNKVIRTAALASSQAGGEGETSDEATLEQIAGTNTYKTTISLPEGNPKFYVYANTDEITAAMGSLWNGQEVSSKDASNYYDVTNSSFFMSTANGLGSTDVANEPISSDTEENLVDVDIERAAVKISVEVDQDAEATDEGADASDPSVEVGGTSAGTIHSLDFAVKSVAKSFYLLCQASQAMPGDVEFDKTTTSVDADFVNVDLTKSIWGENDAIDNTYAAYKYCLENIQTAPTNATYLNFKTTFTPKLKVVITADDTDDNDDFDYKVNGTTEVTLSGDEETYPSFFVIRGASDGQYDNRYIMKSDLVGEDGQFKSEYGISAKATGSGYTVEGIEGITELSAEYTNGVCWFGPIYIPANARDNNNYSIYRNDWYHMTVTQITLPGVPTEPEGGDDDGDANVTVRASVLPWNFVATNLELGPNTQTPTE